MDLFSPKDIKLLLSKYETRPSKGLGQNFLIDENVLEKIITSADIKPSDVILEVGPGIGTLTQALAKVAGRVVAVEKDETMTEVLKETLKDYKNVEVIQGDILKNHPVIRPGAPSPSHSTGFNDGANYKVVANIPYYITAPLIRSLLESKNQPESIILMLQKEVAERICSNPPKMSLLAVSVQFYAKPKIVSYVSKNCFYPAPKIDSAIIKIVPNKPFDFAQGKKQIQRDLFFEIVKAGFSQPRKQLGGNLSKMLEISKEKTALWLQQNGIDPTQRAETLSVGDWIKLTETLVTPQQ